MTMQQMTVTLPWPPDQLLRLFTLYAATVLMLAGEHWRVLTEDFVARYGEPDHEP